MSDNQDNQQKPTRLASSKPDPFSFSSSRHRFAPVAKPKRRRVTELQASAIEKKYNDDVHDTALKNRTRKGVILSTSSFLQKNTQNAPQSTMAPSELANTQNIIPEDVFIEDSERLAPVNLPRSDILSADIASLTRDLDGVVIKEPTATLSIMSQVADNSAETLGFNNTSSPQLYLVQLPTSIPHSGHTAATRALIRERNKKASELKAAEERRKVSDSSDVDAAKTIEMDQQLLSQSGDLFKQKVTKKIDDNAKLPPSDNILTALPSGKLGKITVHASGKMYLHMNGVKYDVTPGATVNLDQELYSLEPERAVAYHLGQITKRMIISPNTESLLQGLLESNRT